MRCSLHSVDDYSTAWVGTLRASAVSLPCLSALVFDFRATTARLAVRLCDGAATVGVVLSNDPDTHVDCFGRKWCGIELGSVE